MSGADDTILWAQPGQMGPLLELVNTAPAISVGLISAFTLNEWRWNLTQQMCRVVLVLQCIQAWPTFKTDSDSLKAHNA